MEDVEVTEMQWEAQPDYWDRHPLASELAPYWCDGKRKYTSRAEALKQLIAAWGTQGRGDPCNSNTTYYCTTCLGYHIGDMSIKLASPRRTWIKFRKSGKGHWKRSHRP